MNTSRHDQAEIRGWAVLSMLLHHCERPDVSQAFSYNWWRCVLGRDWLWLADRYCFSMRLSTFSADKRASLDLWMVSLGAYWLEAARCSTARFTRSAGPYHLL